MSGKTVIDELVTLLGFEVDAGAFREAKKAFSDLHFMAVDLIQVTKAVGRAFLEPIADIVKTGTHALRLSDALGTTVEGFQELSLAAEIAGVDAKTMERSLYFLAKTSYEATHGNKRLAEGFARMGVDVREAGGHLKTTDKIFLEMIDKLEKVPDANARVALAFRVLGRGAQSLIPLLSMGSGAFREFAEVARNSGAIISEEVAVDAENLNFAWKMLNLNTLGLTRSLGGGLLPIAKRVVDTVNAWYAANRGLIAQKVEIVVEALTSAVYRGTQVLMAFGEAVDGIAKGMGGWAKVMDYLGGFIVISLITAVGTLTGAFLAMDVSAGLLPLLLGLAAAALFIVAQDLNRADSLIKEVLNSQPNPKENNLYKAIRLIKQTVDDLKDAFEALNYAARYWLDKIDLTDSTEAQDQEVANRSRPFQDARRRELAAKAAQDAREVVAEQAHLIEQQQRDTFGPGADPKAMHWGFTPGQAPGVRNSSPVVNQSLYFNGAVDAEEVKRGARTGAERALETHRSELRDLPRVGPR